MAAHHRYFVIDIELANGSKHLVGAEARISNWQNAAARTMLKVARKTTADSDC